MAIKGSITIEEIQFIEVDADPAVAGLAAPSGSLAAHTDTGVLYSKYGNANTEWAPVGNSKNVKRVGVHGAPFTSIADAIASCDSPSSTNRYMIWVGAGIYTEPAITVPSYVSIVGKDEKAVVVKPAGNHNVFTINNPWVYMSFFSIENAPTGYSAIHCENAGSYSLFHKLHIASCDNGIKILASTTDTYIYTEYCDIEECATSVVVNGTTNLAYSQNENLYVGNYSTNPSNTAITVYGNSEYIMQSGSIENIADPGVGDGLHLYDGASVRISNTNIVGWDEAITVVNTGSAPNLELRNPIFTNNTTDFHIHHASTTGYFLGYSDYSKRSIPPAAPFFVANKDSNIITVSKKGGDFTSISDAMDSITDSSPTNEYLIDVGPGVYTSGLITCKPYVSLRGRGETITSIVASANNHNLIDVNVGCVISGLSLSGVGSTYAAIVYSNKGDNTPERPRARLSNIIIEDCDIGIKVYGSNATIDTHMHADFIDIRGTYSYGAYVENAGGICACLDLVHYATLSQAGATELFATGADAEIMVHAATIDGDTNNTAFHIQNGAQADVSATIIKNCDVGFYIPNTGSAPDIKSAGVTFVGNTTDVSILHTGTTGVLNITAAKAKIDIQSTLIATSILDPESTGFIVNGPLYYSPSSFSSTQEIGQIIQHGPTMGVMDGGVLSIDSGLVLAVSAGYGYYMNGPTEATEVLVKKTWSATTITLPANSNVFVYFNNSGTLTHNAAMPDTEENILLGKVSTGASAIMYIQDIPLNGHHYSNKADRVFREVLGGLFSNGSIVTENGTRGLDVTAGEYYYSQHEFLPAGGTGISFDTLYRSATAGQYVRTTGITTVPKDFYDDGSGTLAAMPTGKHAKHLLMMLGGPSEKYALIYATEYFSTQAEAESAALPNIPAFMDGAWVKVAGIVIHEASTNISSILDVRPRIGVAAATTGGGVTAHADLTGLGADDHTQYLLTNGSRAMSGSLDMGTNNITNVGTVDGVDISAHASRHLPNGADPLATAAASSIGSANTEGINNSFARSDHGHDHGSQTTPTHHAAATTSANGFMSSADKTKLDGIASGATANSADSFLLDRANHTGTQTASTISDFTEAAQDAVGAALGNTATVNLTYNDAGNAISADVNDNSITDAKITTGIDAIKIADGTVSNTEFQYINSLTSNAQTQIDSKANLSGGNTFTGKQVMTPTSTDPGLNVGSFAGDPSAPTDGDIWYNSTSGSFKIRESGTTVELRELLAVRVLTSGTSYTPTAGTAYIKIKMVGGGGGGGGCTGTASNAAIAGGGGSGAYLEAFIPLTGTAPYTYAIGGGGTAGAAAAGTGGAGGSTSITIGATTYTAPGGSGGAGLAAGTTAAIVTGGAGAAVATNGNILNIAGQSGWNGQRLSATSAIGGSGAPSLLGRAGGNLIVTASNNGGKNNASGYGSGGGGAVSAGNGGTGGAQTGGTGSQGVIIIEEYC